MLERLKMKWRDMLQLAKAQGEPVINVKARYFGGNSNRQNPCATVRGEN